MKKAMFLLVTLVAFGFMGSQALAWYCGPYMGYGGPAYTANQAPATTNGNVAQLRTEISSIQAQLSNELAKDKVNMDKVRKLNQKLGQKQQALRSTAIQGNTYGQGAAGYGGYGYRYHGPMMGRGYMPCW